MKQYKVTCKKCAGSNVVNIDDNTRQVAWQVTDRIISARFRLDNEWGFQCICGNNSLMTKQEREHITDPVKPDPKEITTIIKNLIPDKLNTFEMRVI